MSQREQVLWEEGMFLAPQHFQQAERHRASANQARITSAIPFHWGLTAIEFDEDALAGGELLLKSCRGVFHDGTVFDVPGEDVAPGARRVADAFDPTAAELEVRLALPKYRVGGLVHDPRHGSHTIARYTRSLAAVVDENSGALERDIAIVHKNLRVLFAGEPTDDYQILPIGAIRRTAAGAFELSKAFIPPCLFVGASPVITSILRRVFELLSSKSEELVNKRGLRLGGQAQFSMAEATGFWLLYTVNSFLPAVMHHFHQPRSHPEDVYRTLASLAGALCTFSQDQQPRDVPLYDHSNLSSTFAQLEAAIRSLPESLIPDRCVPIPLERVGPDVFLGRVHDEALLDRADLFFAVHSDLAADRIVREFPFQAKISSPHLLEEIRNSALRGVPLTLVNPPPADIVARSGWHYFQATKDGKHWLAVRETQTLSLFVPQHFADVQVECMAVKHHSVEES